MDHIVFVGCLVLHVCFVSCFLFDSTAPRKVQVLLTKGDQSKLLSQEPDLQPISGSSSFPEITVDKNRRFQTMDGFGGAISNSAAYVIFHSTKRHQIMQDLFNRTSGLGISYIRLTMGASDFMAVPSYTYDDLPNGVHDDFQMQHFSIQKDLAFVIPILKEALIINPKLKIVASPWSPPAWMKTSNKLFGGDFRSGDQYQKALTLYFVKFIQAYKAQGIPIDAITIQNEPMYSANDYPTMKMTPEIQRDLVKNHLGPEFQNQGINTKILIFDHNWDINAYPRTVLSDHEAAKYVTGVAWHCYGGDSAEPEKLHGSFPNIETYFTECSGGGWATNWQDNLVWFMNTLFIEQPRVWAKGVLVWNIALDEHNGPKVQVGGCKDCRGVVTVNSGSGSYHPEVEYYVIGHMSKVTQPGARRIESSDNIHYTRSVAFQNPDGTTAVVVLNTASYSNSITLNIDGSKYNYNLPAKSVASFLYSP